jgi:hypothetical protein
MGTHGFQLNTTIQNAFWRWVPSHPTGRIILVALIGIQYIEASTDYRKVWIYYALGNWATTPSPLILEGDVAQAFMNDLGQIF